MQKSTSFLSFIFYKRRKLLYTITRKGSKED
jgi:hypothetical protein